ncbi:MAG: chorismate-binding protein [Halobacteriovoraceae bacterium]|nr:chorismate-binding protein [Halobacteriovoraceae bacterium]
MKTINSLPSTDFWTMVSHEGNLIVLNSPSKVLEIRRDSVKDLVSGEQLCLKGSELLEELLNIPLEDFQKDKRIVFHAFYELGHQWMGTSSLLPDTILGYWIEFTEEMNFSFSKIAKPKSIKWSIPSYEEYKIAFDTGVEHLFKGDCYQFNITFPIQGEWDEFDLEAFASQFLGNAEKRGEYASLTVLGDKALYSNSPECLGNIEKRGEDLFLKSRPIKGTVSTEKQSVESAWKELKNSQKDESELYMITDLLRNDMNRIGSQWVEVLSKKSRLVVNNLVHSFSELELKLETKAHLKDVIKPLFPGGSITGVPKKRVMEILKKIEIEDRGFYCGSTLLFGKGDFKTSINIRSGVINFTEKKISYHSGGGITVKSKAELEYQEFLDKFFSFVRPLNE